MVIPALNRLHSHLYNSSGDRRKLARKIASPGIRHIWSDMILSPISVHLSFSFDAFLRLSRTRWFILQYTSTQCNTVEGLQKVLDILCTFCICVFVYFCICALLHLRGLFKWMSRIKDRRSAPVKPQKDFLSIRLPSLRKQLPAQYQNRKQPNILSTFLRHKLLFSTHLLAGIGSYVLCALRSTGLL